VERYPIQRKGSETSTRLSGVASRGHTATLRAKERLQAGHRRSHQAFGWIESPGARRGPAPGPLVSAACASACSTVPVPGKEVGRMERIVVDAGNGRVKPA
jgi:hypothetical protein